MTSSERTRNMLLWSCLFTCLALGQGFFLPSFSSSSHPKKSEVTAIQWPGMRDSVYYGQHYHGSSGLEHAVPVAVPYPVAVPAPAPHAQVAIAAPPSALSASSQATFQTAYHNMQLVPCLCSVPKDDIDDNGAVVVQSSQQITN